MAVYQYRLLNYIYHLVIGFLFGGRCKHGKKFLLLHLGNLKSWIKIGSRSWEYGIIELDPIIDAAASATVEGCNSLAT